MNDLLNVFFQPGNVFSSLPERFMEIGLLSYGFSKLTKAGMALSIAAVGSLWILYVMLKMAGSLFQ